MLTYLQKLTRSVEIKLKEILPSRLAIIFEGWLTEGTHYEGGFPTYPSLNASVYEKVFLGISSKEDGTITSAKEYYDSIFFVFLVSDLDMTKVVALTGDDTSTNRVFSRMVGLFLLATTAIVSSTL